MADGTSRVAALGIVVTTNVPVAKAELQSLGPVGEASAKKVEDSFRRTATSAQQLAQQTNVSQRAAAQMGVTLEQVAAAANGDAAALRALASATQQVTVAANQSAVAMARMASPAVSFRNDVEQVTRFAPPAISGFRQLADATERAAVSSGRFSHELEGGVHISHSAIIGFGELARGVGRVAESGTVGAFAMREFGGAATRLGSTLGPVGGLAGVFVLLGGVIVETFTRARREMEATRQKFEEEIAKMANAGQASAIARQQRALLYGQPFDEHNQLRAVSRFAPGSFEGSLADLEAHFAELQRQVPRGATMAPAAIADEWNKVVKALDEARTKFAQLREAALNVANQPSEMTGLLPVVTTEKVTDAQKELEAQAKFTAASMDRITDSLKTTEPQWTLNRAQYERNTAALKELNAVAGQVPAIEARNAAAIKAREDEAKRARDQAQAYSDDLSKIWRDGIAKITTDGFKSFLDFAEDLNRLFTRIMDRMAERARQLGKEAGGAGYTALGIGVAAISGGVAGYQSGNAGVGILAGGLAGSAFGPVGIAVGALAGLTGGLLGGAEAARQRREAEEQLRKSLEASITGIKAQLGTVSDLDAQIAAAKFQFDQLRQQARGSVNPAYGFFGIDKAAPTIAELNQLEQQYLEQLREEARLKAAQYQEDLRVRLLRAQGNDVQADALELQLKQQRERDALIKSFGDTVDPTEAATLALLDQVQAQEKLAASSNKVASGFLNIEDGLRVMADRFNAIAPANNYTISGAGPRLSSIAAPPVSSSATSAPTGKDASASMTVILNMDGREVARGVVKNLQRKASATLGTTIDWSKVSAN